MKDLKITARYGGAEEERSIWYHGTHTGNLNKILSEGLITEPPKRAWQEDTQSNFQSPSKASLGGIYLTQNLMTARSSYYRRPKNENPVIVITELQPRSLILDEDDISYHVKDAFKKNNLIPNEYLIGEIYMSKIFNTNKSYVNEVKEDYVKNSLKALEFHLGKMDSNLKTRVEDILKNNWETVLNRQASYVYKDEPDYQWKNLFYRNIPREQDEEIRKKYTAIWSQKNKTEEEKEKEYKSYVDKLMPPRPDSSTAERNFALFTDQLTKTLKSYASPSKYRDRFNITGRSMDNIGFSGSNKIICIVVIIEEKEVGEKVKVVYGNLPNKFIEDWKKNVGELRMAKKLSWYKESQKQPTFDFFSEIPIQKIPVKNEEYERLKKRIPNVIKQLMSKCDNLKDLLVTLKMHGFKCKKDNDKLIVNDEYVVKNENGKWKLETY